MWAAVVTEDKLKAIEKDKPYLGKGLDAVKTKDAALYEKMTVAELDKDNVATGKRLPKQTFFGFDPVTGTAKQQEATWAS